MIRVICADISGLAPAAYEALYKKASPERRRRADRYLRWEDAVRCIAADALLRYALGTPDYAVEKGPSGKPYIQGRTDFCYNLSHSGRWVVIAFGPTEVGVDVEQVDSTTDTEAISRRFFAPEEQNYILGAEKGLHQRFFEIWTAKESYLKFLGTGLKKDLASFSVLSLEPQIRLFRRTLPGDYCLTLCTTDDDYLFTLLDAQRLL